MTKLLSSLALLGGFAAAAAAQDAPRALVADVTNESKAPYTVVGRVATDTLALELVKSGVYDVISRTAVERAAKLRGMKGPFNADDLASLARDLDARLIISGEIRTASIRNKDRQRQADLGLVVRVLDLQAGSELINGAAEHGDALDSQDGHKSDGLLYMDAAISAAVHCANRIATFRPLEGTILNSSGQGFVVLNRGVSHGMKKKQEFIVYRRGIRVGRLGILRLDTSYTDMSILDNQGIQPGDHAVAVFPEPKLR